MQPWVHARLALCTLLRLRRRAEGRFNFLTRLRVARRHERSFTRNAESLELENWMSVGAASTLHIPLRDSPAVDPEWRSFTPDRSSADPFPGAPPDSPIALT